MQQRIKTCKSYVAILSSCHDISRSPFLRNFMIKFVRVTVLKDASVCGEIFRWNVTMIFFVLISYSRRPKSSTSVYWSEMFSVDQTGHSGYEPMFSMWDTWTKQIILLCSLVPSWCDLSVRRSPQRNLPFGQNYHN